MADVEFDIQFTPTSKIHAALFESRGDTRLSEAIAYLFWARDKTFAREVLADVMTWFGFSHYVLSESRILPASDTVSPSNYVFHKMNKGFGVARLDLDYSIFKLPGLNVRNQVLKRIR